MFFNRRNTILTAVGMTLLTLAVAQVPGSASAQSFSCANAQIPSEMAICNNERLLVRDETVAALLAFQLVDASASGETFRVSYEHSQWLKTRNACQNDMDCLMRAYDRRIRILTSHNL